MEYLLKRISNLNHVGIIQYDSLKQTQIHYEEHIEFNPITHSEVLKKKLVRGRDRTSSALRTVWVR